VWDTHRGYKTVDPLEFLARGLVHIPDKGHVTTRFYGWYTNRPRDMRGKAEPATADGPPATVPAPRLAPTEATRSWAVLLQQIFEVDPLACPTCHGAMRIVAFITQASVIDPILTHLRTRATAATHGAARSPPPTRAPGRRSRRLLGDYAADPDRISCPERQAGARLSLCGTRTRTR
jgi:hypothetical protein